MGSILLTQEGTETSRIREEKRDEVLRNFFEMMDKAVDYGDKTYMTSSAYQHHYSFGDYYPSFLNMSWEEFSGIPSLSGVKWGTWNFIVNDFKRPWPSLIQDEQEFQHQYEPRGEGGFEEENSPDCLLCNVNRWKEWHREYLTNHPDKIIWNADSPFFPNQESIYLILDEEINKYILDKYGERINKSTNPEKEIRDIKIDLFRDKTLHEQEEGWKPLKKNAKALFFHRTVIPSVGHINLAGYCMEIGDRICRENFYIFEPRLSSAQQRAANAQRHIWSIKKNNVKQYISFDFHKGMFEFHNDRGEHIGEFMFDGTQNAGPQINHNFITVP